MSTVTITNVKIKRGTNTKVLSHVAEDGELVFNLDTHELSVGDNSTAGGIKVSMASEEATSIANQLATKLDRDGGNMTASEVIAMRAALSVLSGTEINTLLTAKLDVSSLVNDLTSSSTTQPLTAAQGKVLKTAIDNINTLLSSDTTSLDTLQEIVDYIELNRTSLENLTIASISGLSTALAGKSDTGHTHTESDITDLDKFTQAEVNSLVNNKVTKNSSITAATKCKVTYDSKGLVTGGENLSAADIPSLDAAKVTSGTFGTARIPNLSATKITSGEIAAARLPTYVVDGGVIS